MILCKNCLHKNPPGAIFCAECGAQLAAGEIATQSIRTDKVAPSTDRGKPVSIPKPITDNAWASLHLMDSGQILSLADRNEYTLGRLGEGQPVVPDLDLSPHQAYAAGVSRIHALIKRDGKRVTVMDLGSANGTYVNGKRLASNSERLLNHGDVVALGKFKFQILLR
ncbi:MAG: FHA domain-containing protein [Anaerolineaceae bacterium]|nr:MAG: FHA domain-containing protein [Anaerolineaceae bacterium]